MCVNVWWLLLYCRNEPSRCGSIGSTISSTRSRSPRSLARATETFGLPRESRTEIAYARSRRSQTSAATKTDFYDDTNADFNAATIAATEAAEAKLMEVTKAHASDDMPVPPSKLLKSNPGDKKRASNTSTCVDVEATPCKKIMNLYTGTIKKSKKVTP